MAKVLICDKVSQEMIDGLKTNGHKVFYKTGLTEDELIATVPGFQVMVVRSATKVTEKILDAATDLKVVIRGGVGIDNIKHKHAESKGISVRNTPSASSPSVAELALGHMFSVYRFIAASTWRMRKGDSFKDVKKEYEGLELGGKTLGIIGIGRIGRELAKRAHGIGMTVIAYDPYIKNAGLEYVEMVSLDDLLGKSHFVSLHIPSAERPVIGKDEFAKMKKGAVLINCARGGVVCETSLLEALDSGQLLGAGIDVFEGEPNPRPEIVNHPRVSVTPHLGASTEEAQTRISAEVVDIVQEIFG